MGMTIEELRDYVEEQRNLNMIPYHVYSTLIDGIDTLEVPTGKWIIDKEYENTYRCSKCGERGYSTFNYCIRCGTRMIEVEEQQGE